MMINTISKYTETIRAHEVDFNNNLKLSALFNYGQHAAASNADEHGFGYKDLFPKKLYWVLTWIHIQINELPGFEETMIIETWPKKRYRLYSLRDFNFYNAEKKVLAKATTAWLLLNAGNGRIFDTSEIINPDLYNPEKSALEILPDKVNLKTDDKPISEFPVKYSDLDILNHMNNAKYVDHIMDVYSYDFLKNNHIKSITLSFMNETKINEQIKIYSDLQQVESKHFFKGLSHQTGKQAFYAILEWN